MHFIYSPYSPSIFTSLRPFPAPPQLPSHFLRFGVLTEIEQDGHEERGEEGQVVLGGRGKGSRNPGTLLPSQHYRVSDIGTGPPNHGGTGRG